MDVAAPYQVLFPVHKIQYPPVKTQPGHGGFEADPADMFLLEVLYDRGAHALEDEQFLYARLQVPRALRQLGAHGVEGLGQHAYFVAAGKGHFLEFPPGGERARGLHQFLHGAGQSFYGEIDKDPDQQAAEDHQQHRNPADTGERGLEIAHRRRQHDPQAGARDLFVGGEIVGRSRPAGMGVPPGQYRGPAGIAYQGLTVASHPQAGEDILHRPEARLQHDEAS